MFVVYFLLVIGPLVVFHELGHFLLARLFGIRVLEFSVGFGPQIAAFTRGDTTYRIAPLPLGGYVRILGQDRSEVIPPELESVSFQSKPLWQRTLVIAAGPAFSLLLPFIVFFFAALADSTVDPAVVGTVRPDGPAAGKLLPGDIVTAVNDEPIDGWWELTRVTSKSAGKPIDYTVRRGDAIVGPITIVPENDVDFLAPELGVSRNVGRIHITPHFPRPVVVVDPAGAAAKAGLRSWDLVASVDAVPMRGFHEVTRALESAHAEGRTARVAVVREGSAPTTLAGVALSGLQVETLDFPASASPLGLSSAEATVHTVTPGTPAAAAGLLAGDSIVAVDGRPFWTWRLMTVKFEEDPKATRTLTVARPGREPFLVAVTPDVTTEKGEFNQEMPKVIFGAENRCSYTVYPDVPNESRFSYAIYQSISRTLVETQKAIGGVVGLFTGKLGLKSMGGPVFIFQAASKTEQYGWRYYAYLLAMLSISLGLLNLLPVPFLDGGHLLFFLIEAVKRSPVALRTQQIATYVGLSAILLLMLLVLRNDLLRLFG